MRVTVKATQDYFDKVLKSDIKADTELEVDEARAKVLVSAGVAVVISEVDEETADAAGDESEENTEADQETADAAGDESEENTEADQETADAAGDDETEEKAEKKPTKKKVKKDE